MRKIFYFIAITCFTLLFASCSKSFEQELIFKDKTFIPTKDSPEQDLVFSVSDTIKFIYNKDSESLTLDLTSKPKFEGSKYYDIRDLSIEFLNSKNEKIYTVYNKGWDFNNLENTWNINNFNAYIYKSYNEAKNIIKNTVDYNIYYKIRKAETIEAYLYFKDYDGLITFYIDRMNDYVESLQKSITDTSAESNLNYYSKRLEEIFNVLDSIEPQLNSQQLKQVHYENVRKSKALTEINNKTSKDIFDAFKDLTE